MMTEKRKRERAAYRRMRRAAGVRYTVEDLVARGEHLCWVCGGEVDLRPEARVAGEPESASVDHVVRLCEAHGDRDKLQALNTLDNLRLAHKRCNQGRHAHEHAHEHGHEHGHEGHGRTVAA